MSVCMCYQLNATSQQGQEADYSTVYIQVLPDAIVHVLVD